MQQWRLLLTANGEDLGEVNVKRGIFQGDNLSLLLSVLSMVPKKNFMAPFYGWGSTASRLKPLRGGSLLFTTKFPEIPGTHYQPQKDERLS